MSKHLLSSHGCNRRMMKDKSKKTTTGFIRTGCYTTTQLETLMTLNGNRFSIEGVAHLKISRHRLQAVQSGADLRKSCFCLFETSKI